MLLVDSQKRQPFHLRATCVWLSESTQQHMKKENTPKWLQLSWSILWKSLGEEKCHCQRNCASRREITTNIPYCGGKWVQRHAARHSWKLSASDCGRAAPEQVDADIRIKHTHGAGGRTRWTPPIHPAYNGRALGPEHYKVFCEMLSVLDVLGLWSPSKLKRATSIQNSSFVLCNWLVVVVVVVGVIHINIIIIIIHI